MAVDGLCRPRCRTKRGGRRLAWIAAFVLGLLAIAGAAWSAFGPETIVLTEPQLQERVNRQLPREFRGVTVERATLGLADGRISLHVEARATALGQAIVAAAFARGVPRYNAEGGEIFFDAEDVRLENFRIGTGSLAERAERLGARLGGASAKPSSRTCRASSRLHPP
jgi:hypothetical protein